MFEAEWDKDKGVYKVKAFGETYEFTERQDAIDYINELKAWLCEDSAYLLED